MTDFNDGWEEQTGGLWLKVSPYNRNDPEHQVAVDGIVRSTVQTVASAHGASCDERAFHYNMQALNDGEGDLEADLCFAKWDVCERKAICLGAALGWDTYAFTPDGELVGARYTEDFALVLKQRRELMRAMPKEGKWLPPEGVATCLERINLRKMREEGLWYRVGEVAPDNTAMVRQLDGNKGYLSSSQDSGVIEHDRLPENLLDYLSMDVKIRPIKRLGVASKRHFIAYWKQGPYDVRFIVTKGKATTIGKPRIDIRTWDNGNPPDPAILECIAASTLRAVGEKATELKWNARNREGYYPSPLVPAWTERGEIWKALFEASGNEIVIPLEYHPRTFDEAPLPIHVHVIGQEHMLKAFKGQRRFFGGKPMIPGMHVLNDVPTLAA